MLNIKLVKLAYKLLEVLYLHIVNLALAYNK